MLTLGIKTNKCKFHKCAISPPCLALTKKTINLSEITKNRILVTEGVALLLCVLLPSAFILFKVTVNKYLFIKYPLTPQHLIMR